MPGNLGKNEKVPFKTPKLVPILIGAFLFLFFGGIVLVTFLERPPKNPEQNSESYSALGHHALVEILQRCGFRVFRSHHFFYLRERQKTILFIEPDTKKWYKYTRRSFSQDLYQILSRNNDAVIVCPKWRAMGRHHQNEKWIRDCDLRNLSEINRDMENIGLSLEVKRMVVGKRQVTLGSLQNYTIQADSLQYFRTSPDKDCHILAQTEDGRVIAYEIRNYRDTAGKIICISDPDLLNNMGIHRVANGPFIVDFLKKNTRSRTLWVDEVCHGLGYPRSIMRALLTYPGICVTLQALLVGLCLAWLAGIRFRPPLPVPVRSRSMEEQVKSFANITSSCRRHNHFLNKYLRATIMEMNEYYPSIGKLPFSEKIQYLEELGKARGLPLSIQSLYQKSLKIKKNRNVIVLARAIHKWKGQMLSYKKKQATRPKAVEKKPDQGNLGV